MPVPLTPPLSALASVTGGAAELTMAGCWSCAGGRVRGRLVRLVHSGRTLVELPISLSATGVTCLEIKRALTAFPWR